MTRRLRSLLLVVITSCVLSVLLVIIATRDRTRYPYIFEYDDEGGIPKLSTLDMGYYAQEGELAAYYDENAAPFPFPAKNIIPPSYMGDKYDMSFMDDRSNVEGSIPPAPAVIEVKRLPWLLADDYIIAAAANAVTYLNRPRAMKGLVYEVHDNSSVGAYLSTVDTPDGILLSYRQDLHDIRLLKSQDGVNFERVSLPMASWRKTGFRNSFCMYYDELDPDIDRRFKVGYQFHETDGTDCPRMAFSPDMQSWKFPMASQGCCSGFLKEDCGTMADCLNCVYYSAPLNKYIVINRKTYATERYFRDIRGVRFSGIDADLFHRKKREGPTCSRVSPGDYTLGVEPCQGYNNASNWKELNTFAIRLPYGVQSRHVTHIYSWGVTAFPSISNPSIYIGIVTIMKFPRVHEFPSHMPHDKVFPPDTLHTYLSTSHDGVHWDLGWIYNAMEYAPMPSPDDLCTVGHSATRPGVPRNYFASDKLATVGDKHYLYYIDYHDDTHERRSKTVRDNGIHGAEIPYGRFAGVTASHIHCPYRCTTSLLSLDVVYDLYSPFIDATLDGTTPSRLVNVTGDYAVLLTKMLVIEAGVHLKLNVDIPSSSSSSSAVYAYLIDTDLNVVSRGVVSRPGIDVTTEVIVKTAGRYRLFLVVKCAILYGVQFV